MKKIAVYIFALLAIVGCKDKFLDVKPNDALVVPKTIKDLQALLDNDFYMNGNKGGGPSPGLLFAGTDEYYYPDNLYNKYGQYVRNAYTWQNVNLYAGLTNYNDWASPYRTVYYANVVIDGLQKINETTENKADYDNALGSALFYRAFAFYQLAQTFAQPYISASAKTDLGIPLRLKPDVTEKGSRANVQQTYDQIQADLQQALTLLPDKPLFNTRPSRLAAYALLSRMYLGMASYDNALSSAENCLKIKGDLLDFNTLSSASTSPMPLPIANPEVIFNGMVQLDPLGSQLVNFSNCIIDSTLYALYKDGDLRKTVCYKIGSSPNSHQYKASYTKATAAFSGIAIDEIYLIKAECQARKGDATGAMATLNTLLKTRWKSGAFVPVSATDAESALTTVLTERRKELVLRGTRWTDLKRLNRDSRFSKTVYRFVVGKQFTLPPNDSRYTWQIPDVVIDFNPGMPQNPR